MAKKVTNAGMIRNYLAKQPGAQPAEIVKWMAEHRRTVKVQSVYSLMYQMRKKGQLGSQAAPAPEPQPEPAEIEGTAILDTSPANGSCVRIVLKDSGKDAVQIVRDIRKIEVLAKQFGGINRLFGLVCLAKAVEEPEVGSDD